MRRQLLDVVGGVAHRDRDAAVFEHRQIVLHVADGGDRIGRNPVTFGDRLYEGAFVAAGRGDIEIIALRSDRGGVCSQRPLHRDFAALQQCRIGARADDLAGSGQIRCEIRNDGRIGADGAYFVWDVFAIAMAGEPELAGKQPDIDPEFVEHIEAPLSCRGRNQMLFDHLELRIDDAAAVEGPDRQRDRKRLDQKPHADGRTAGGDGKADAGIVQPLYRGPGAVGQRLVFCQQRAVDVRYDNGDAGHEWFLLKAPLSAGLGLSWRMISSTIVSTEASIDTVTGFSPASGGSSVLNWL